MHTATVSSTVDTPPERVREAIREVEPFMRAAGFDEVAVDGECIHVANSVGIADIELELAIVETEGAVLAYQQREGIFEEMHTEYRLTPVEDGTEVTATTTFALDVALVGSLLDATIIDRQRRTELRAQLSYLDEAAGPESE